MQELNYIEVKIEPIIYDNHGIMRQLKVHVKFMGQDFYHTEELRQSDAMSVLDYCFDRAKHYIKFMIDKLENCHGNKK